MPEREPAVPAPTRTNGRWGAGALVVIAAFCGVFGLQQTWMTHDVDDSMVRMGALTGDALRQPWRLLSSSWLHFGWGHLVANAVLLFLFGRTLERLVGWQRFVLVYCASALGAAAACLAVEDPDLAVGASGGVFGVLAAVTTVVVTNRTGLPDVTLVPLHRRVVRFVTLIVLLEIWGYFSGASIEIRGYHTVAVSAVAHATGACIGIGAALVLTPRTDARGEPRRSLTAVALAFVLANVAALAVALQVGRPWDRVESRPIARVYGNMTFEIPELDAVMRIPPLSDPPWVEKMDSDVLYSFGDVQRDPFELAVFVSFHGKNLVDEAARRRELDLAITEAMPPVVVNEHQPWPTFETESAEPGVVVLTVFQVHADHFVEMTGRHRKGDGKGQAALIDAMYSIRPTRPP